MARSLINLNLFRLTYAALAAFAQTIHNGFVALALDYPAPNPTMPIFQTDIDELNDAITAWGVQGNHGSHADHVALIAAATIVRNDLRMLASYAQNRKPDDFASWTNLGFNIKRPKSAPVSLQMVQNFHLFIARDIPSGKIKLKWKRPLATDPGDVKGYIVQFSNTIVQPAIDGSQGVANIIGIIPNTSVLVEPQFEGANYFWVTPFNSVGYGVSSDPLLYNAPGNA
jgi:hypothetical protein